MTIRIDGTNTAANPGITGADADTGLQFGTDEVNIVTGGNTRATVDSSGRLLVGTTTAINTADGTLLQAGHTNGARMILGNSSTTIPTSTNLGMLSFRGFDDSTWQEGARISAVSSDAHSSTQVPTDLRFYTVPTGSTALRERMRVDHRGQASFQEGAGASVSFHVATTSGASGSALASFRRNATLGQIGTGTEVCRIARDGDLTNTNNSYGSLSDEKLKENIVDANSQWNDIKALQVRNYNFKAETGNPTHSQIGVIAQEVELVSPGLVTELPDIDEAENDLGTTTKSVNYSVLYMKAVKALQEAMTRIEQLETRVAQLEGGAS